MFSASDVAKEIKNVGELLEKRGQSAGASAMATGMIQNMCIKLAKLSAANITLPLRKQIPYMTASKPVCCLMNTSKH